MVKAYSNYSQLSHWEEWNISGAFKKLYLKALIRAIREILYNMEAENGLALDIRSVDFCITFFSVKIGFYDGVTRILVNKPSAVPFSLHGAARGDTLFQFVDETDLKSAQLLQYPVSYMVADGL